MITRPRTDENQKPTSILGFKSRGKDEEHYDSDSD